MMAMSCTLSAFATLVLTLLYYQMKRLMVFKKMVLQVSRLRPEFFRTLVWARCAENATTGVDAALSRQNERNQETGTLQVRVQGTYGN